MKPKRIFSLLLLLALVGFGVFGAVNRLSYPETTANPDYMDQLQVATLSQDGCDIVLQNMQQKLPQSPIILRVTPTSDLTPIFYAGKQRFLVEEVYAAHDILRACGLEKDYVEVVACPTCGRCRYDCMGLASRVEARVRTVRKKLKVAVMGCVVNGPGEAKDCDLGIAGGEEYCVIMQKGRENERIAAADAERVFFARLNELIDEK